MSKPITLGQGVSMLHKFELLARSSINFIMIMSVYYSSNVERLVKAPGPFPIAEMTKRDN